MMADDFEDMYDIDELEDAELRDLVLEQLEEQSMLDVDQISVRARDGHVTLSGTVGTDGERRVAEHVLTDVLGVQEFTNDLLVDPSLRATTAEVTDDTVSGDEEDGGALLGDVDVPFTTESEHLADEMQEDLGGTSDYQRVMEDGMTYNPPDSPTPEGMRGTDAGVEDRGEAH
jgi:hypothetical protein